MSTTTRTNLHTLTVTLADGTVHAEQVGRMPACWKSWLMRQLPYGTDFTGCVFARRQDTPGR